MISLYSLFFSLTGRDNFIHPLYLTLSLLYMCQLIRLRIKAPKLSLDDEGISIPKNFINLTTKTYKFDSIKDIILEKNWNLFPTLKIIRDGHSPIKIRKRSLSAKGFFDFYNKIETRLGKPKNKNFEEFKKEHRYEKNMKMMLDILALDFVLLLSAIALKDFNITPSLPKISLYVYLLMGHLLFNLVTKRVEKPVTKADMV